MTREMTLVQKLEEVSKGTVDVLSCIQEVQSLNQTYVQSIVQAMQQYQQSDVSEMLKSHRKLRKAIAYMEKTQTQMLVYECGTFAGVYRVMEETNRIKLDQEEQRELLAPLERKHVNDVLNYLYENPEARQGKMAEKIGISPSHMSEILNLLLKTGYVKRYGEHKNTRYYLSRAGKQAYMAQSVEDEPEEWLDIDYKEIINKENFIKERALDNERYHKREEDEYANWASYFGTATETAGY